MNSITNIATAVLSLAGITIATVGLNTPTKKHQQEPFCPAMELPLIPDVDNLEPFVYKHCKCGIGVYLMHDNDNIPRCTSCGKSQAE